MSAHNTPKPFGYPDTVRAQNAYLASKTRCLPDGQFEAVASIFFMGKRGLTVYAVARSRYLAQKEATSATESQSNYRRALAEGRISLSPATATGSAA